MGILLAAAFQSEPGMQIVSPIASLHAPAPSFIIVRGKSQTILLCCGVGYHDYFEPGI